MFHSRSKHFEVDYHYIRERVALGLIDVTHIPAAMQLADIFTKSLPRRPFELLRTKLGVGILQLPSLRGSVSNTIPLSQKTELKREEVSNKMGSGVDNNQILMLGLRQSECPSQSSQMKNAPNGRAAATLQRQSCKSTVLKKKEPAGVVVLHNHFEPFGDLNRKATVVTRAGR